MPALQGKRLHEIGFRLVLSIVVTMQAYRFRWKSQIQYLSDGLHAMAAQAAHFKAQEELYVLPECLYGKYTPCEQTLFKHYVGSTWHGGDADTLKCAPASGSLLRHTISFRVQYQMTLAMRLPCRWKNTTCPALACGNIVLLPMSQLSKVILTGR